ncbi:glucose-1-phosphate adenylyltransferase subunit GlgD [Erysipelotrichaceae bacterium Oil+RF-744-GAM-WT-6]|uniref:Glucose-1-phosphate adenylyltransferase subunit GlgD n=1 Tax=Stecheria intestinalis TaxID=2606630 RepID=A0A7X2NU73_9FIRM|nr:glucose-1-phosphate adenylyltransferase subunit GlgD [Stecheria intestinalis]MSS59619.1 glucose-1-phosphate adenylyltransferase subunit GlgD [Stecheria intestinalis]
MRALGIISFEDNTATIQGLGDYRPVPAIAFMGRYRIIDFILSNMTNSGIDNVQVYCKEKPRNLIEHLGDGSHYNINSKRGKLRILYGEKTFSSEAYNHDVANYMLNMQYIEEDPNPYVVIAPSYFVYSLDFNEVLKQHINSKADVTVLYTATNRGKESFLGCDTLNLDKVKTVMGFEKNRGKRKNINVSMEAYVMTKKLFIDLVKKAADTSSLYWFKDILADSVSELDMRGYQVRGYVGCLNSLEEYFRISMELRDYKTAQQLFRSGWPIYTQTNDSCPTKYTENAEVHDSVVANGAVIDGKVEKSLISRNVTICKGAEVENCIILPGAYIGENAKLDHVIVDKYAIVHHVKKLAGTDAAPVYVKRRDRI